MLVEHDLKIDAFDKDLGVTLAQGVMPLGYARLSSIKNRLSLNFKDLDYNKFVVGPPAAIVVGRICRAHMRGSLPNRLPG